ncbi:putative Zn-dependent protease [Azospirillum fermentarium]|uniref:M48 family metalloprotease n=1 Tax=Azospirillum fermentarium TaxID=1233114 RepID=UPI00222666FC|nr:M48 family metalloprotease [Azospirillum fermentarium]MCW2246986.1 putative Zn-dependent protease [Azospirillum fermentarium]
MMRRLTFFSATTLAMSLAGCISTPTTRVTQDPKIIETAIRTIQQAPSPPQCTAIRGPHLLEERQIINSPELNRELRRILDDVRTGWTATREMPPIDIYIVANDRYNGFTNIHNQIFINLGVLAGAETRDEIAFMVAHEMAHASLGHIGERRQRQLETRRTFSQINDGISLGVVLANTHQINAGQNAAPRFRSDLGPGDMNTVAASAAGMRILSSLYAEVGDALYSREQETYADLFAYDRLMDTKQSVNGTGGFYDRLHKAEDIKNKEIAVLKGAVSQSVALATALALRDAKPPDKSITSLSLTAASVFGPKLENMIGDILSPWAERYDPIVKRRETAGKYEDSLWKNAEVPPSKPSPFTEKSSIRKAVKDYMEAISAYNDAENAIMNQNPEAAAKAANNEKLQRLLPVLGLMTKARLSEADGKLEQALHHAEAAKRHQEATPGTFTMVATLLTRLDQPRRALSVLDEAEKRFCTREPFLVTRAGAMAKNKDKAGTLRALSECDATGDAAIGRACYLAARPEDKDGKEIESNPLVKLTGSNNNFLKDILGKASLPF